MSWPSVAGWRQARWTRVVAFASGALITGLLIFLSSRSRVAGNQLRALKRSLRRQRDREADSDLDSGLILEQLTRNQAFLTDAGLSRLRSAFVIVVGCGGVGSHATATLARSGVGKLRLIDFDQVTLSSLNRHAVANLADVGTPKVQCLRKHLEQVTPWVQFDCRNELFLRDAADRLLGPWQAQPPDYILDAIDNIDSKVALLSYCHAHSLPVISSMGAGCKSDPTRIFVGDISASLEDPLSRVTRRRLRLLGVERGIAVVYSTEKPGPGKAQLLPLPDEALTQGDVGAFSVLPDFRVRILPVLGTMPAVFGYTAANHVILHLARYPHEYGCGKTRDRMYDGILSALHGAEERLATALALAPAGPETAPGLGIKLPVTREDIAYLVEEVYRGRSVLSGVPTRLALIRWQRHDPQDLIDLRFAGQRSARMDLADLVCMTKEEAAVHEREVLKAGKAPQDFYDEATVRLVRKRMDEERAYAVYR
ncbi:MAG: hypothetical protein M1826_001988 [Phylliscum demangeonii]|nr:MAG: hypothetical protein M1826_001988 [Phylliscum demangeonii]